MKINNISQINQVQKVMKAYGNNKTEKVQKAALKEDQIDISQKGKDFQIAMEAYKNLPEVREEKINELREQINSGTYKVDKEKLAKAMVNNLI